MATGMKNREVLCEKCNLPLDKPTRTIPVIQYEEKIVPTYRFVEKDKEIPRLVEVPIETLKKSDVNLVIGIVKELGRLRSELDKLRDYKIKTETIVTQDVRVLKKEIQVDKPVYKKVSIDLPFYKPVEISRPVYKDEIITVQKVNIVEKDKEVINAVIKDVQVKNAVPVDVEVQNVVIREKVISTIEELLKQGRSSKKK